jgi:hypothetical protein
MGDDAAIAGEGTRGFGRARARRWIRARDGACVRVYSGRVRACVRVCDGVCVRLAY